MTDRKGGLVKITRQNKGQFGDKSDKELCNTLAEAFVEGMMIGGVRETARKYNLNEKTFVTSLMRNLCWR